MIRVQNKGFGRADSVMTSFHYGRYCVDTHMHQFSEIAYVTGGKTELTVAGRRETLQSGDVAVIPSYQPHAFYTKAGEPVRIWIMLFSPSLVADVAAGAEARYGYRRSVFTPSHELRTFIKRHLMDTKELPVVLDARGVTRMKALLYPIFEEYTASVAADSEIRPSINDVATAAILYAREHFREDVTLAEVCARIGYSKSHVSHSLSAAFGMNFRTILNSFRLDMAQNMLVNKNTSIYVIASECGFGTERSFHRAFMNTFGITPTEYRSRIRAGGGA